MTAIQILAAERRKMIDFSKRAKTADVCTYDVIRPLDTIFTGLKRTNLARASNTKVSEDELYLEGNHEIYNMVHVNGLMSLEGWFRGGKVRRPRDD